MPHVLCVAARLWERCIYSESCIFIDENTICTDDGECRCGERYTISNRDGEETCVLDQTNWMFENSDVTTVIMVVSAVMIATALFCLVLRLFSRARFGRNRAGFGNAAAPSVMLTDMEEAPSDPHSRRLSRCSSNSDYLPGSGRASYSMLAPPASAGSRRSSSISVRSQGSVRSHASSFRSQSSFRSYRGGRRDSVRRTRSTPTEASTSKFNHPKHTNKTNQEDKVTAPSQETLTDAVRNDT
ncbi:uncharacterized protein LOC111089559 [Limulus polyphemus]|uniref:Uncharacterized protein LOC111089559 n=1 Tax=Limulus polyphemus TaxID=6850 RepID=A0ABM1TQ67_LIMPO|nr:uncharacterized protein LOC111089559 [Limulus polyphemus]